MRKRLLYYDKPRLGGLSNPSTSSPIPTQIVMSNGDVLLGASYGEELMQTSQGNQESNTSSSSIIVSWTDPYLESNKRFKSIITLALLVISNVSIAIMLLSGKIVDISQSERDNIKNNIQVGGIPEPFDYRSISSTNSLWPEFVFVVLRSILCLGACLDQSPTGFSLYILSTLLCFLFFATSIPSIICAGRYLLEIATCYQAYGIRNGMMVNWLCPPPQSSQ